MTADSRRSFVAWLARRRPWQRLAVLLLQAACILGVIPYAFARWSPAMDRGLHLPHLQTGLGGAVVGAVLMLAGLAFVVWAAHAQGVLGRGTWSPTMPTQRLIVRGPYAHCRNPLHFGMGVFYAGLDIWLGSPAVLAITVLIAIALVTYDRYVEERELAARFGEEYVAYKQRVPFVIPRWPRR
jgi:protein-S-isoprenylcysteine O-methyltransferase Ste14